MGTEALAYAHNIRYVMLCYVVTVMRWYAQDEVNQEDSEQVDEWRKELDDCFVYCCLTQLIIIDELCPH